MRRATAAALAVAAAWLGAAASAQAHIGSFDAVQDGMAGPYHLLVTIRPPAVIPGVARIDVRAFDDDVARVSVVPLPIAGPGASSPPVPDVAAVSPDDPHLYGSTLWLMRTGSWKIRVSAQGARGAGELSVPIPALARAVRPMPGFLGALLFGVLVLLVSAAIAIAGASLRESDLPAGTRPDARRIARGRRAMAVTAALLALGILGGRRWWNAEASLYRRLVYKPLQVAVTRPSPDRLSLALADPGWLGWRRTDDLIPDHGHLMHLFLVRAPGMDAIAHLHPRMGAEPEGDPRFGQAVPPLPAGSYRLFGDIVHANGIDETVTASVELAGGGSPDLDASRFDPDDAMAVIPRAGSAGSPAYAFTDGKGTLRWLDARAPRAGQTVVLEIEAEGSDGRPAGVEPYMGMAGHAMILARDGSVFAHIHPTGSVPMAAMALVDGALVDHAHHHGMLFAPRIRFPYVFPHAGPYRLFVQVKLGGRVETAAWDVDVAP
ncbi:MAG TPA: hypothetical protein VMT03_12980 [Polyangia bacterium]|nr:hypothetical protein [Polyangia bacterium]